MPTPRDARLTEKVERARQALVELERYYKEIAEFLNAKRVVPNTMVGEVDFRFRTTIFGKKIAHVTPAGPSYMAWHFRQGWRETRLCVDGSLWFPQQLERVRSNPFPTFKSTAGDRFVEGQRGGVFYSRADLRASRDNAIGHHSESIVDIRLVFPGVPADNDMIRLPRGSAGHLGYLEDEKKRPASSQEYINALIWQYGPGVDYQNPVALEVQSQLRSYADGHHLNGR